MDILDLEGLIRRMNPEQAGDLERQAERVRAWAGRSALIQRLIGRELQDRELFELISYTEPRKAYETFDGEGIPRAATYAATVLMLAARMRGNGSDAETGQMAFDLDLGDARDPWQGVDVGDEEAWEQSLVGIERDSGWYRRFATIGPSEGRHTGIALTPPEEIAATKASYDICNRWDEFDTDDGAHPTRPTALELSRALYALSELWRLHVLFSTRGIITPMWEYVYDLDLEDPDGWGPDPFMGLLPTILGAIARTNRIVTERAASEVAERVREGTWETVRRAAERIHEDYRAALFFARERRPELRDALGDVDADVDRYEALRRAAATPWGSELREAVLSSRRDTANPVEASIVRYTPDHVETATGQSPRPVFEMVLKCVGEDREECEFTLPTMGHKREVTYKILTTRHARELIRKLPREDRTVSGLMSYAATYCEVVRDVSARTPGDGPVMVSAEMVVKARAMTEGADFLASKYRGRVEDAHNAMEALANIHMGASFPLPGGRGNGETEGPIISYLSVGAERDASGNVTRDVWLVPRMLGGLLGAPELMRTESASLPEGASYKQIDSDMRQYLMDQADRFYRGGERPINIPGREVVDMGRQSPPEGTGDSRYKVQNYEYSRIPDAYDRVLPDVLKALREASRNPVRFELRCEDMKPTKKMARRRRITGLRLSGAVSWKAAMRGVIR